MKKRDFRNLISQGHILAILLLKIKGYIFISPKLHEIFGSWKFSFSDWSKTSSSESKSLVGAGKIDFLAFVYLSPRLTLSANKTLFLDFFEVFSGAWSTDGKWGKFSGHFWDFLSDSRNGESSIKVEEVEYRFTGLECTRAFSVNYFSLT